MWTKKGTPRQKLLYSRAPLGLGELSPLHGSQLPQAAFPFLTSTTALIGNLLRDPWLFAEERPSTSSVSSNNRRVAAGIMLCVGCGHCHRYLYLKDLSEHPSPFPPIPIPLRREVLSPTGKFGFLCSKPTMGCLAHYSTQFSCVASLIDSIQFEQAMVPFPGLSNALEFPLQFHGNLRKGRIQICIPIAIMKQKHCIFFPVEQP